MAGCTASGEESLLQGTEWAEEGEDEGSSAPELRHVAEGLGVWGLGSGLGWVMVLLWSAGRGWDHL